jgi:hypothetical protein
LLRLAATILGISTRQTRRLIVAYRASGGASVIHKARGRASNNRLVEGIREYAVELVRSNYADFGPSLAAEMLLSKHDVDTWRRLRFVTCPICRFSAQMDCFVALNGTITGPLLVVERRLH